MKRGPLFIKAALSVLIVYHLAAVILLPNPSSILARRFGHWFTPYANEFVLNRTWQFFSPSPTASLYLEYEVITPENELDTNRETFVYPKSRKDGTVSDFYIRSLTGMRFLAIKDENFEKFFVPYLCRQHPGATALDIRSVVEELPPIESAGDTDQFKDMAEKTNLPRRTYSCKVAEPSEVAPKEGEGV